MKHHQDELQLTCKLIELSQGKLTRYSVADSQSILGYVWALEKLLRHDFYVIKQFMPVPWYNLAANYISLFSVPHTSYIFRPYPKDENKDLKEFVAGSIYYPAEEKQGAYVYEVVGTLFEELVKHSYIGYISEHDLKIKKDRYREC